MVLRGVSQRETIRSRAAKVIAVTALDFGIGTASAQDPIKGHQWW
jgi:hypothetical protein